MTTTPPAADPARSAWRTADTSRHDLTFWVCVGIGVLLMGYGLVVLFGGVTLIEATGTDNPIELVPLATALRFAVILLLNDLVLMPLVFGFAVVVFRLLPAPWLPPARFALFVSAMVLIIAIWGLAGQVIEVQPGNEHVLPNSYPRSVAILLTPVWLFALGWGWYAQRQQSRGPDRTRSERSTRGSSAAAGG